MEADKTVNAEVGVSDLTTAFHSQNVPMPICRYEVSPFFSIPNKKIIKNKIK